MFNESNAQELTEIAKQTGALVLRAQLRYPGPKTSDRELGTENIPNPVRGPRPSGALEPGKSRRRRRIGNWYVSNQARPLSPNPSRREKYVSQEA